MQLSTYFEHIKQGEGLGSLPLPHFQPLKGLKLNNISGGALPRDPPSIRMLYTRSRSAPPPPPFNTHASELASWAPEVPTYHPKYVPRVVWWWGSCMAPFETRLLRRRAEYCLISFYESIDNYFQSFVLSNAALIVALVAKCNQFPVIRACIPFGCETAWANWTFSVTYAVPGSSFSIQARRRLSRSPIILYPRSPSFPIRTTFAISYFTLVRLKVVPEANLAIFDHIFKRA